MNKIEDKSWQMLTSHEQNSLSLNLSHGMSTWEAGEILGISHYKYLEIKERSEKFFKLFIDYFNTTGLLTLFHPQTVADSRFRDYIEACIEKRMTRPEASIYTGDSTLRVQSIQTKHITQNMNRLKSSPLAQDNTLFTLIMEFDRWNNKRILPRVLQMPSAYKRRNNKRDKAYIKFINQINPTRVENMLSLFSYNPKKSYKKRYYVALISSELFEGGYEIIQVKDEKTTLEKLNNLYIYVFKDKEHADIFGHLTSKFSEKTHKPRAGQQFWPEYREAISRAINFKEINNIYFYAEDLEKAYRSIPISHKPAKQGTGVKRAPEKFFE